MLEILNGLRSCWEAKRPAALATILAVDGSVYRRQGARCLIHDDGRIVGIVSGGCVEKDLFEYAQKVIQTGVCNKIEYDFRSSEDAVWGLGLGCNGALTIWIQPFDPVKSPDLAKNLLEAFERRVSSEFSYLEGTVIDSNDETSVPIGQVIYIGQDMQRLFQEQVMITPYLINEVEVQLFVERVKVRPRLVIFGVGTDVKPLTKLAKFLEWHVTIVDYKQEILNKHNFPDTDKFIISTRENYGNIEIPVSASVVIMTHNYELDKRALEKMLPQDIAYLGQLGPLKRLKQMIEDLESSGSTFKPSYFHKLHSPIGLDIGAETPEEIALCIIAEICARRNRRTGISLRERVDHLHALYT